MIGAFAWKYTFWPGFTCVALAVKVKVLLAELVGATDVTTPD